MFVSILPMLKCTPDSISQDGNITVMVFYNKGITVHIGEERSEVRYDDGMVDGVNTNQLATYLNSIL